MLRDRLGLLGCPGAALMVPEGPFQPRIFHYSVIKPLRDKPGRKRNLWQFPILLLIINASIIWCLNLGTQAEDGIPGEGIQELTGALSAQAGSRHLVTSFFICQKIPSSSRWGKETLNYVIRALTPPMTEGMRSYKTHLESKNFSPVNHWSIPELQKAKENFGITPGLLCDITFTPLLQPCKKWDNAVTNPLKLRFRGELCDGKSSSSSLWCYHTFLTGTGQILVPVPQELGQSPWSLAGFPSFYRHRVPEGHFKMFYSIISLDAGWDIRDVKLSAIPSILFLVTKP